MPQAQNETTIARRVDEVFAFLADAENDPAWRESVLDITRVSGSGVGTRYRQGVKGPGGRRIDADVEIVAYEPSTLIGFRATSGPVRPTGRYELDPVDDRSTRVRFTLHAELGGLKLLLAPMVKRSMASEVGALEKLKRVLEAS